MKRKVIVSAGTMVLAAWIIAGCQKTQATEENVKPQAGNTQQTQNGTVISEEEARNIALADAGVAENEVTDIRVRLGMDDGVQEYEVDFYAGSQEYDYDIDASTGAIRSKDMEIEDDFINGTVQKTAELSEDEAKNIALADAGVAENEVANIRVRLGMDDGVQEYEVDFYVGNQEYDYDIDASTGGIRSKDMEIEDDFYPGGAQNSGTSQNIISEADAKAMALERVPGATEQDLRIKLDHDDGRQVYEGSIFYDRKEYEFEIDAQSGQMLSWEEDWWD